MERALTGKTAIVTGASKGIGRGLAIGLAQHGAAVIVNYKTDADGAERTREAIAASHGTVEVVQADVAQRDEVRKLVQTAVERFGRLDILVNNAGRTRFGPAAETTLEDWEDVVGTNLRGPFFASVAAAAVMETGGSIINISSCAARLMINYHALYTMSKTGLEGITKQMALEYAPRGIRVNALAPAATSMERNWEYDPNFDANWSRVTPAGAIPSPADYVGTVVYLGSDASRFLTGAVLNVDGAWSIKGHTPDMSDYDFETDRRRG